MTAIIARITAPMGFADITTLRTPCTTDHALVAIAASFSAAVLAIIAILFATRAAVFFNMPAVCFTQSQALDAVCAIFVAAA